MGFGLDLGLDLKMGLDLIHQSLTQKELTTSLNLGLACVGNKCKK